MTGTRDLTLVTLAPWCCSADAFELLTRELSEFRAHRLELAGFGLRQDDLPLKWTFDWAVDDVARQVEEIGGERLVFIGSSIGGTIALALAARHLPRLHSVVTIGSAARLLAAPDYPLGASSADVAQLVSSARADFGALMKQSADIYFNDADRTAARQGADAFATYVVGIRSPEHVIDILEGAHAADIRDELGAVDVPVLLLYGAIDLVTPPAHGTFLRERLPRAELEVLCGTGHVPFMTAPRETAAVIRTFLAGI